MSNNNNNNNAVTGMNSYDSLVNLAASIQHPISTTMTSTLTSSSAAAGEGVKLGGSTEDDSGNNDSDGDTFGFIDFQS